MSDRLRPKDIKHDIREDEVQTFLMRLALQLQDNPVLIFGSIGGVLALILAGSGVFALMENRRAEANASLAEAMRVYAAPVGEAAEGDDASELRFATEDERRARVEEAFGEVSGGAAGDLADLYQGELALSAGDPEAARAVWQTYVDDAEGNVIAMSMRLNLLALGREQGRAEEVAEELRLELERAERTLPEDVLLYELARTYEELERGEEAREHYQRILDEHPQSPYTAAARRATTAA
ncbi:MAG: tetratricopeptide repeat protein [Acidobacteriota bacterium]